MVAVALDPFWTLALALLLDAAIGKPGWLGRIAVAAATPVARAIGWANVRLNRPQRPPGDRWIRGALVLLVIAGVCAFVGDLAAGLLTAGAGLILKALVIAGFVDQRAAFDAARAAVRATEAADPYRARRNAARRLATALTERIAAPALFYALFGLAGLFAFGAALAFAERIGADDPFGGAAHRLLGWIGLFAGLPAAVGVAIAAAFSPGARPGRALALAWSSAPAPRDARSGWTLAALAGALDLSFERRGDWIGDGRARLEAGDLRRVLYLFAVACLCHLVFWAALGFMAAG